MEPRRRHGVAKAPWVVLVLLVLSSTAGVVRGQGPQAVLMADIDGPIGRATVDLVEEALGAAQAGGYGALILRLDTPGGELGATEQIVDMILRSPMPVLGYVGPVGARAASAGTIILESTDLAAMAPFTTIGSVQPVLIGPAGFQPINDSKIINFVVASLQEKLALHHRNTSLARAFVVDNLNLNATQAFGRGAIELVASTVGELLQGADNRALPYKGVVLHTAGARVAEFGPSARTQALELLSNPLIASLLLLIGIYALIFGLSSPGHGAEIAGIILILLGLIGLGFSASPAAAALIVLGLVLLFLELKKGGHGVFGIPGIIALLLGAFFLARLGPLVTPDYQAFLLAALLTPTGVFGGFLLFALYKVAEIKRRRPVIGLDIVGEEAGTVDPLGPDQRGYVLYRGEMWSATADEPLPPGERVIVTQREGLTLKVRRKREGETPAISSSPGAGRPPLLARFLRMFQRRSG